MSRVEDTLRSTFRERVAAPPSIENLADRAVAGARQVRRARTAFASVAAALCVALVGFGIASFVGGPDPRRVEPGPSGEGTIGTVPPPSVSPTPEPSALPDVVIGDRLVRADGGETPLDLGLSACGGSCWIDGAWRVPDGLLIRVYQINAPAADTSTLWLVPESGTQTVLVEGHGDVVVSPGTDQRPGIQVAWAAGAEGLLKVGTYVGGAVTEVETTPLPYADVPLDDLGDQRPLYPQAVVGGAVVLAGTYQPGSGLDLWDAWFPDRGDFVRAEYPVIGIHATTVDGERLIGWYYRYPGTGLGETCLGELDPNEFAPAHSACPSPFAQSDRVLLSDDGRLWMVIGAEDVALYDAEQVWSGAGPVRSWPVPTGTFGGAWLDGTSFAVMTTSSAVVLHTDGRPEETTPLRQPGDVTQHLVVDDLR